MLAVILVVTSLKNEKDYDKKKKCIESKLLISKNNGKDGARSAGYEHNQCLE